MYEKYVLQHKNGKIQKSRFGLFILLLLQIRYLLKLLKFSFKKVLEIFGR